MISFGQTKANPSPLLQSPGILQGGGPPGGTPAPPESDGGGNRGGKPEALSQPVDPGGVGGLTSVENVKMNIFQNLSF